ncbi:hypothetical protein ACF3DV_15145 [Chlorogloeopsis fritschii PCC 9212]|nr:hypothetical protein [Chlorogloeopsis fritschii]
MLIFSAMHIYQQHFQHLPLQVKFQGSIKLKNFSFIVKTDVN